MIHKSFVVVAVVVANGSEPLEIAQSHLQTPRILPWWVQDASWGALQPPRIFAVVVARRRLGASREWMQESRGGSCGGRETSRGAQDDYYGDS